MENLFVPYDAEITAKTATQPTAADGWLVAQVASNERAFALGLAHGWSEADPAKTPGLVDGWKKQMKTQAEVTQLNLPISEGYFTDTKGNAVSRSAFDYLRDHVGYRYELLSASWQNKVKLGAKFEIKIRIANRGFSACPTPRGLDLAYVDSPTKYTLAWRGRGLRHPPRSAVCGPPEQRSWLRYHHQGNRPEGHPARQVPDLRDVPRDRARQVQARRAP